MAGEAYVGTRLLLHSLESRPELNGHVGTATAWDDSLGTFTLSLEANSAIVTASHWQVRTPSSAGERSLWKRAFTAPQ